MKKVYPVLICTLLCVFLFVSCGLNGKNDSEFSDLIESIKSNDQGEDDDDQGGNGKKPPVVDPPDVTPPEEISANISVSMRTGFASFPEGGARAAIYGADVIVMLTLSDGEWNSFSYPWVFNDSFLDEKVRLSKWFTLSYENKDISIFPTSIESRFAHIGMDDHPFGTIKIINPKVLSFRFPRNLSDIYPSKVTLNEEKLEEMKILTNIKGTLTVGEKIAYLNNLQ